MILYHGSNMRIDKIDLSKSKPGKDFGKGFYLSDKENQALDLAAFKAEQLGGKPIITKFIFDENGLYNSNLKIKKFNDYSLDWVEFIIANRMDKSPATYDFVYGPIADDKVGRQLRRFFDEDISKEELLERLKYMKGITFQYFFGSTKALTFLKVIDDE